MPFETHLLNDITGPMVDDAQAEAERAKDYLQQVLHAEVFSNTSRQIIMAAAAHYASCRAEIVESKIAQDNRDFVSRDMQHFDRMMTVLVAPDSPQGKAIRADDRATFAEIQAANEKSDG